MHVYELPYRENLREKLAKMQKKIEEKKTG